MPFFKAGSRLVFYAHVPKCGGSALTSYMRDRFGPLAFHDGAHLARPEAQRWTRTSPQHADAAALARLFPPGFFDAAFAVVRHPADRLVSAFHFQKECEGLLADGIGFSDWLAALDPDAPFAYDNHLRPMTALVPEGATVFHLEHGLDALVPWFDLIAGDRGGPRAILPRNERAGRPVAAGEKVRPSAADLERIAALYAEDFRRFGYRPEVRAPLAPPPEIGPAFLADRDAALRAAARPLARLRRRLRGRLRFLLRG